MAKRKVEEELSDKAKEAAEKLKEKRKAAEVAAKAEAVRFDEAAKVFASPEWVETYVIPLGDRGAELWRSLKATWPNSERWLKKEWNKFSKDLERK